jgi:hypothetical protein
MKLTKIISLLFLTAIPLLADGGSIYTRFGIGDLRLSSSSRRLSMGELGIAMGDQDYLSALNPAGWSSLGLTRIETSFLYNGTQMQSSSSSVFHSNTYFDGVMFGFPIDHDRGISLVFGLVPVSNVAYDVTQDNSSSITDPYTSEYTGTGGLSKFFIGTSYKLPLDFSIGASFDYYMGRIENTSSIQYVDTSTFQSSSFQRITNFHGINFTAGMISPNFGKFLGVKNLNDLRFGLTFSPSFTLDTDSLDNSVSVDGTSPNGTRSYKTKMPYKFGAGVLLKWTEEYTFTFDYLFQPFSQYREDGRVIADLQDFSKMSLGFEYRADSRSNSFWDHVMLRGGLSYEQSQYIVNGISLNQYSVYTGFSMPISYANTIDFGFQYGKRGTKDNGLLVDNFYRFSFSISLGDVWFVRTER